MCVCVCVCVRTLRRVYVCISFELQMVVAHPLSPRVRAVKRLLNSGYHPNVLLFIIQLCSHLYIITYKANALYYAYTEAYCKRIQTAIVAHYGSTLV